MTQSNIHLSPINKLSHTDDVNSDIIGFGNSKKWNLFYEFMKKASDSFFSNFVMEEDLIFADQAKNILDSVSKEFFAKSQKKSTSDDLLDTRLSELEDQMKNFGKHLIILLNAYEISSAADNFNLNINNNNLNDNNINLSKKNLSSNLYNYDYDFSNNNDNTNLNYNSNKIDIKTVVEKVKYSDVTKLNTAKSPEYLNKPKITNRNSNTVSNKNTTYKNKFNKNANSTKSNLNVVFSKRILSKTEKNLIFSCLPSLIELVKLKDDNKRKFGLITNELIQNFKILKDALKINNIENFFYRSDGFYLTLIEEKSKEIVEKFQPLGQNTSFVVNNKIFLLDDLVFIESFNNKNFVNVPKYILKFLYFTFIEFREIIHIKEIGLKDDKFNSIISSLIKLNRLPDFLVKCNIQSKDGIIVYFDLLSNKQSDLPELLSRKETNSVLQKFPSLAHRILLDSVTDINSHLETLKTDSDFPKHIFFSDEGLTKNNESTAYIRSVVDSNNATDIYFDISSLDLIELAPKDCDLNNILNEKWNDEKLIKIIFHLNYLYNNKKLHKQGLNKSDLAVNTLRNCAIFSNSFDICEIGKITTSCFEDSSKIILSNLSKNGIFYAKCTAALDILRISSVECEFNKVNDIISPDLVVEINSLFSSLESNSVDILDQMKKMCNITANLNNLISKNESDADALRFLKSLCNEKYLSLKKQFKNYHIFKNRKLICPSNFNLIIIKTIADIKASIEIVEITPTDTDINESTQSNKDISLNKTDNNVCHDCNSSVNIVDINLEEGLIYLCKTCLVNLLQTSKPKVNDEIVNNSCYSPIVTRGRAGKEQTN